MNQTATPAAHAGSNHLPDKTMAGFVDSSGSEATRELRGVARRRHESEEKLQLHLQESKERLEKKHLTEEQGRVLRSIYEAPE